MTRRFVICAATGQSTSCDEFRGSPVNIRVGALRISRAAVEIRRGGSDFGAAPESRHVDVLAVDDERKHLVSTGRVFNGRGIELREAFLQQLGSASVRAWIIGAGHFLQQAH